MSNYILACSLYRGYLGNNETVNPFFSPLLSSHAFLILVDLCRLPISARIGGAIQLQPREISVIIVWQTVANEKLKISAGIRSQLVRTDLSTQDRYPTLGVKQTRSYLGDPMFGSTLLHSCAE